MNEIELDAFLALRRHLKIAHHMPGRIRVRIGAGVFEDLGKVDRSLFDRILGAVAGIKDVRVNPAAGSIVVAYTPSMIEPAWWETLIHGKEAAAKNLLRRLLDTEFASAVAAARDC